MPQQRNLEKYCVNERQCVPVRQKQRKFPFELWHLFYMRYTFIAVHGSTVYTQNIEYLKVIQQIIQRLKAR